MTATSQVKNNQKVLVIERKWSSERQLADVQKRNEDDENEYRRLVGLSAILLKISQSVGARYFFGEHFARLPFSFGTTKRPLMSKIVFTLDFA